MTPPRSVLANHRYASHLGVELVDDHPLSLRLPLADCHANFLGLTHGGAVHSLADCAVTVASGGEAEVVDTHLVLTAGSQPGDVLTARVEETTRGRTLATYRVLVTRGDGRVVGVMTAVVRFQGA